jgi:hypothetical protein
MCVGYFIDVRLTSWLNDSKPKSVDVKVVKEQDLVSVSVTTIDFCSTRLTPGIPSFLALCMQIVKLMGGRMGVDSQLGVGSTFW